MILNFSSKPIIFGDLFELSDIALFTRFGDYKNRRVIAAANFDGLLSFAAGDGDELSDPNSRKEIYGFGAFERKPENVFRFFFQSPQISVNRFNFGANDGGFSFILRENRTLRGRNNQ